MANGRMLTKGLLMNNHYLKVSNDSKALYQYLVVFADDDGIVERSMMIDAPLQVDDSNYKELEQAKLIISYDDQIKVVTDWNALQTIRKDIYTTSEQVEVKKKLYLRTDFSYSTNKDDDHVMISLNDWITFDRPKDREKIKQFQKSLNVSSHTKPFDNDF